MTVLLHSPDRDVTTHPCFSGPSGERWGRIHLPVAAECNVQCNFCNRLYDCANESRPAVTRGILDPSFAVAYLDSLLKRKQAISVVGIAGPGDPMAEPEATLETIRRVHARYPGLLLCLSTNGLNLPGYVDALALLGVTHVTVTVNAVHPVLSAAIYRWVRMGSRFYHGREGAEFLLDAQREAVVKLKEQGIIVKINTVVVPGVNDDHVGDIAREAAAWGADIMNCIPIIPIPGTPFSSLEEPGHKEMERVRALASPHVPQMRHCRRCRADAAGFLHESFDEDLSLSRLLSVGATGPRTPFPTKGDQL